MSHPSSIARATAAFPDPDSMITSNADDYQLPRPSMSPTLSNSSSTASSSSESERKNEYQGSRPSSRRSRAERPRMSDRKRSASIIVSKGREVMQDEKTKYPPDDARAMSPRRSSEDLEKLEHDVRQSLKTHARTLQSSLAALAEKIDEVKSDHDKLESENRFLQDYIGGLTRTMSTTSLGRSSSLKATKKKGRR